MSQEPKYIHIDDAADLVHRTPQSIRRVINDNGLEIKKVNKQILIKESDLFKCFKKDPKSTFKDELLTELKEINVLLKNQIAVKDRQIEFYQEHIRGLQGIRRHKEAIVDVDL